MAMWVITRWYLSTVTVTCVCVTHRQTASSLAEKPARGERSGAREKPSQLERVKIVKYHGPTDTVLTLICIYIYIIYIYIWPTTGRPQNGCVYIYMCVIYVYIDDAFKWRCNHLIQRMEWNPICTQHSNRTQLFRVWQVHSFAAGAVLWPTKHQHGDWMAPKSGFPSAAWFFLMGTTPC